MEVHRSHCIAVDLPKVRQDQLRDYFSQPARPMKALLNRRKVRQSEPGCFHYESRPYVLLTFQLQPVVIFRTRWDGISLSISFEKCTIRGLGSLEALVQFHCEARIRPEQEQLIADADLSLAVPSEGVAMVLPKPVLRRLGEQALQLVVDRLEKRCRRGLVKGARDWASRHD